MSEWSYDHVEAAVAVVGLLATLVVAAYRIGKKITHLEESTVAGLDHNAASIEHVSQAVKTLGGVVHEFQEKNHLEHQEIWAEARRNREKLIEHGTRLEMLRHDSEHDDPGPSDAEPEND